MDQDFLDRVKARRERRLASYQQPAPTPAPIVTQDNDLDLSPATDKGYLGEALSGIKAQAAGVASGLTNFVDTLTPGRNGVLHSLTESAENIAQENAPSQDWSWQDIMNSPLEYLKSPSGATYDATGALGSSATLMAGQAALNKAANAAGKTDIGTKLTGTAAMGLSKLASNIGVGKPSAILTAATEKIGPALKSAFSKLGISEEVMNTPAGKLLQLNAAKWGLESASEAGNAARDVELQGGDTSEQIKALGKDFALNGLILNFSDRIESKYLSKFLEKAGGDKSAALATLKSAIADAAINAAEEGAQEASSQFSKGEDFNFDDILTSTFKGAVGGGVQGGAFTAGGRALNKAFGSKNADNAALSTSDEDIAQKLKRGAFVAPKDGVLNYKTETGEVNSQSDILDNVKTADDAQEFMKDFSDEQLEYIAGNKDNGTFADVAQTMLNERNGMTDEQVEVSSENEDTVENPEAADYLQAQELAPVERAEQTEVVNNYPSYQQAKKPYIGKYSEQKLGNVAKLSDNKLTELAGKIAKFDNQDKLKQTVAQEAANRGITLGDNFILKNDENIPIVRPQDNVGSVGDFSFKGKAEAPSTQGRYSRPIEKQILEKYTGQPEAFNRDMESVVKQIVDAANQGRISKDDAAQYLTNLKGIYDRTINAVNNNGVRQQPGGTRESAERTTPDFQTSPDGVTTPQAQFNDFEMYQPTAGELPAPTTMTAQQQNVPVQQVAQPTSAPVSPIIEKAKTDTTLQNMVERAAKGDNAAQQALDTVPQEVIDAAADAVNEQRRMDAEEAEYEEAVKNWQPLTDKEWQELKEQREKEVLQPLREYLNGIEDIAARKREARIERDNMRQQYLEELAPALKVIKETTGQGYELVPQEAKYQQAGNSERMLRASRNAKWYSDFLKENKRRPRKAEVEEIAYEMTAGIKSYGYEDFVINSKELEYDAEQNRIQLDFARDYIQAADKIYQDALNTEKEQQQNGENREKLSKAELSESEDKDEHALSQKIESTGPRNKQKSPQKQSRQDKLQEKQSSDGRPRKVEKPVFKDKIGKYVIDEVGMNSDTARDYVLGSEVGKELDVSHFARIEQNADGKYSVWRTTSDKLLGAPKVFDSIEAAEKYISTGKDTAQTAQDGTEKEKRGKGIERIKTTKTSAQRAISKVGLPVNKTTETLYQAAYHGSPHIFDEFSLDHIGEGEGAQAHGWGLYFAQSRKISEEYRKALSKGSDVGYQFSINGKSYTKYRDGELKANDNSELETGLKAIDALGYSDYFSSPQENSVKDTINKIIENIQYDFENGYRSSEKYITEYREAIKKALTTPKHEATDAEVEKIWNIYSKHSTIAENVSNNTHKENLENAENDIRGALGGRRGNAFLQKMYKNSAPTGMMLSNIENYENHKIALDYLQSLKDAEFSDYTYIEPGALFEVEIPESDILLDEQKRLSEQTSKVQEALKAIEQEIQNSKDAENKLDIEDILDTMSDNLEAYRDNVVDRLNDAGYYGEYLYDDFSYNLEELTRAIANNSQEDIQTAKDTIRENLQEQLYDQIENEVVSVSRKDADALIDNVIGDADKTIRKVIDSAYKGFTFADGATGKQIYKQLTDALGSDKTASQMLDKHGIKGITYHGLRDGRCFVVFDDNAIDIKRRYEAAINKHKADMQRSLDALEKDLKDAFPKGKFEKMDDNNYSIALPNGAKIQASIKDKIIINEVELNKAKQQHGLKDKGDVVIQGSWTKLSSGDIDGILNISKDGDKTTAFHEAFHAVQSLALTKEQNELLENHYKPDAAAQGRDVREVMADAYADWELARKQQRGTMFGKLWQKVKDMAQKIKAFFNQANEVEQLMRKIETGEIWEQKADSGAEETQLQIAKEKPEKQTIQEKISGSVVRTTPLSIESAAKNVKQGIQDKGFKGYTKSILKKLYIGMFDDKHLLGDLTEAMRLAKGSKLTVEENIDQAARNIDATSQGIAQALIMGEAANIRTVNEKILKNVHDLHEVSLKDVLDNITKNVGNLDKTSPEFLNKWGFKTWHEAFDTYLACRRLRELYSLAKEAYQQDLKAWEQRTAEHDRWIANGRKGPSPLQAQYDEWQKYKNDKEKAHKKWKEDGEQGIDPSLAIKEEWLRTHEDEAEPRLRVGKKPEFTDAEYRLPNNLTINDVNTYIKACPMLFDSSAKMFYKVAENELKIMKEGGLISEEEEKTLNTKYKEYCPLFRDFSDTAAVDTVIAGLRSAGQGMANVSSVLKKLRMTGSERKILSPLESTVTSIAVIAGRAQRNIVGQNAVKNLHKYGLDDFALEMPDGTAADSKNCIFTVMFDGKKKAYQTTPEYYNAIVGSSDSMTNCLIAAARYPAQWLRTGSTTSPSFIIRNLIRDTVFAGVSSRNGFIPIYDSIRGAYHIYKNSDRFIEYEAAGVGAFNQFNKRDVAAMTLKGMTTKQPIYSIKRWADAFERLSDVAESSTRMGEFMRAREKGKSIQEATIDAKEVTLDFSRAGTWGRQINKVVPFFNAVLQGGDKLVRIFLDNPVGTSVKMMAYIVLPSLFLWAKNKDEDWYEHLDPEVKDTNWILSRNVRIPKPQEAGILFGTGIEAIMDEAYNKDPRAIKNWKDSYIDAMMPSFIPTVFLPFIEWTANYSFFRGKEVVGQRYQGLPDELQFNDTTTEASKTIGKKLNASPMKIDNLVRSVFGTMGSLLYASPDLIYKDDSHAPAKKDNEKLFVRDFSVTDMNLRRFTNDFYELKENAAKNEAGYGEKSAPRGALQSIKTASKLIAKLNKDIRAITNNNKLSPERKRELLDAKRERIERIAEKAVKKYGKYYL